MKDKFFAIFPLVCILAFFLHWATIFILALPSNDAKEMIGRNAPRYKALFGRSWKLFTPPFTYHNRLYFIVRNIDQPNKSDTIEVLANIAQQKQLHAPFNQHENIIDHLVNNSVDALIRSIWTDKPMTKDGLPKIKDSTYLAETIAAAENNYHFRISLATLNNYSKLVFNDQHIPTAGREMKMMVRQKMIRPFNELNNPNFETVENLVFETPYKSIQP